MIDSWRDERDSYDTLYVPFVWVPDGAPQPTEWLAEHPDAFWVPATLVRDQFAVDDPGMGGDDFDQSDGSVLADEADEPGTFEGPQWSWSAEDQAVPASAAPAASRYDDPVAAYLRVNDMFARLGAGHAPPSDGKSTLPSETVDIPTSASGSASQGSYPLPSGSAQRAGSSGSQPVDPSAPVPLTDDDDQPVKIHGQTIMRPAGLDPHFFIQRGLADKKDVEEVLRTGGEGRGSWVFGHELGVLANFRQGGSWDAQRVGGTYHREFRPYATIAIGLYAAAAGISESRILEIQDAYASVKSRYPAGTVFDSNYTHLPQENVENTHLGYTLYKSYEKKYGSN